MGAAEEPGRAPEKETPPPAAVSVPSAAPVPAAGLPGSLLWLQQHAGNRAVARAVSSPDLLGRAALRAPGARTRPAGPSRGRSALGGTVLARFPADRSAPYLDPAIKAIADAHPTATDDQVRALHVLDYDRAHPPTGWTLAWSRIAKDAGERVFNPTLFNQGPLGTCSFAAELNFKARVDPEGYAKMVTKCYTEGQLVPGVAINSTLQSGSPPAGMPPVDWMLMSAMNDTVDRAFKRPEYHGTAGESGEGTTSDAQNEYAFKVFTGAVETKVFQTPKAEDVIPATRKVGELLTAHPDDVFVSIFVSASVLQNPASVENKGNHLVGLTKPVQLPPDKSGAWPWSDDVPDYDGAARADIFTWGKILPWSGTVRQYIHMVWSYVVGSRKAGLL